MQVSVCVLTPAQLAPPLAGAGLLHCLVLVRTPLPQVTEQVPSSKGDQLPSTVGVGKIFPLTERFAGLKSFHSLKRNHIFSYVAITHTLSNHPPGQAAS